jgi:hypothetical protein
VASFVVLIRSGVGASGFRQMAGAIQQEAFQLAGSPISIQDVDAGVFLRYPWPIVKILGEQHFKDYFIDKAMGDNEDGRGGGDLLQSFQHRLNPFFQALQGFPARRPESEKGLAAFLQSFEIGLEILSFQIAETSLLQFRQDLNFDLMKCGYE